jgi:ATP-dependent exoDNAse (exonuclease V) beta subunit
LINGNGEIIATQIRGQELIEKIKNELELIDTAGQSFRIDRLCVNGTKCVVFDYKTGHSDESHRLQINHYDALLSDAGFEVIGKYLIYIDDDLGVRVEKIE